MKLILKRNDFNENGIWSNLTDENGNLLFLIAEHAYLQEDGTYKPKIPNGTYTCKRGTYPKNGETYEVMNVAGHSAILFHVGSYPNVDSSGCCLVGKKRVGNILSQSKIGFAEFMKLMDGLNEFELEVI